MAIKTIVILANSVKHGKHCVAGKDLNTKQWVRPVSTFRGGKLTNNQILIQNPHGLFPAKPLQKVEISFQGHTPLPNQPENWLVDNRRWIQRYKISPLDLNQYLDNPSDLWGVSDRISFADIINNQTLIKQSLYLIYATNLKFYKNPWGKRRIKFVYNNTNYDLPTTDPQFDQIIKNKEEFPEAYLCVSLGEPWQQDNCCYKIVAWFYVGQPL